MAHIGHSFKINVQTFIPHLLSFSFYFFGKYVCAPLVEPRIISYHIIRIISFREETRLKYTPPPRFAFSVSSYYVMSPSNLQYLRSTTTKFLGMKWKYGIVCGDRNVQSLQLVGKEDNNVLYVYFSTFSAFPRLSFFSSKFMFYVREKSCGISSLPLTKKNAKKTKRRNTSHLLILLRCKLELVYVRFWRWVLDAILFDWAFPKPHNRKKEKDDNNKGWRGHWISWHYLPCWI